MSLEGTPEEKITAASMDTSETDAQKIKRLELKAAHLRDERDTLMETLRHSSHQTTYPISTAANNGIPKKYIALSLATPESAAESAAMSPLTAHLYKLESEIFALKSQVTALKSQVTALRAENATQKNTMQHLQAQMQILHAKNETQEKSIQNLQAQMQNVKAENATQKNEMQILLADFTKRKLQRELADLITLFTSNLTNSQREMFWKDSHKAAVHAKYDIPGACLMLRTLLSKLKVSILAEDMLTLMLARRDRNAHAHPGNLKDTAAIAGFVTQCSQPDYFMALGADTNAAAQNLVKELQKSP